MKQYINCSLIIACLSLMAACNTQREDENGKGQESEQPIKINAFLEENGLLLPMSTIKSRLNNDLSDGFMLYGFYNNVDVPKELNVAANTSTERANRKFFDNVAVDKNGIYSGDKRYWVGDGKTRHSFYAYSGMAYGGGKSYGIHNVSEPTTTAFYPKLDFTQASAPIEQQDYLVAYGPTNLLVNQAVPEVNLHFRHACSRVVFKIMASGGVSFYYTQVQMKYIPNRVSNRAQVFLKPQSSTTTNSYMTGTYLLQNNILIPASANTEGKAILAGELKLPPQNMMTSGWLEISIRYTIAESDTNITSKVWKKTLVPAINLEPDRQYTFYFKVAETSNDLTISDLIVEPWKSENVVVDPLE